jgi:uncharacterized membrane protein YdjX (TVP38/TMEM64 family)
MPVLAPANRKKLLFRVALALVAAAALGIFLLKGIHFKELVFHVVAIVSGFGPWIFFVSLAILPALGAPTLAWTLIAGSAFADRIGMVNVVLAGTAAMMTNMLLTYWLARRVFRQWLGGLLERLGYKLPKVDGADMTDLIVILRTTTGIPFFVQNYTLGLVDAPLGRYFLLSCVCAIPGNTAYLIFGNALLNGRGGTVLIALSLLVALAAAMQLLRRHYGKKKRLAAA